jgi:glycosyltransferase involved in cell wall biosynthesis
VTALANIKCEFLPSARRLESPDVREPASKPVILGFLGRWHPNKGADLLIEALGKLTPTDWNNIREVRVCGGGILNQTVRDGCRELSNQGLPVICGDYLDRDEAIQFFSEIDILLLPSRIESIPVVLSDAVKFRCPIVATPVGDLPYIFDRFHIGEIARTVTAEDFAKAISNMLHRESLDFGESYVALQEIFDLDKIVSKFLAEATGDCRDTKHH